MKILITGISGRIGANLAKTLAEAGHSVRGLVWTHDKRLDKLAQLKLELIEGDLVKPEDVAEATQGVEVIYHLGAAFQGGGPFSNEQYFDINLRGTFNLLEAARQQSKTLRQFFFASTDALYNKYLPGGMSEPIREDALPPEPSGQYALTKTLGEQMSLGYQRTYGLPVTVFRFALVVAGDEILDFPQFRLSHWLKVYQQTKAAESLSVWRLLQMVKTNQERLVIARDAQGRAWKKHIVDVRDIVHGLVGGLYNPNINGEVIQLAAPQPFTWDQAVPYLADRLDLDYVDLHLSDRAPTFYEFDLAKARRLLNYNPQYDIFKMIDSAIAFRQGNEMDVIPT